MLHVTPDILTSGGTALIHVDDPGRARESIRVEIGNGSGSSQSLMVPLDGSGKGTAVWHVPASGWSQANFNAPDCAEVSRVLQMAAGAGG